MPPPASSGVIQNKGSSTGIQHLEGDDTQGEQENSSPGEDAPKKTARAGREETEEDEESDDNLINSPPKKAQFFEDYAGDDEQDSDKIEMYFQEDEDMDEEKE